MFGFNPTLQVIMMNIAIIAFLLVIGIFTNNPLVIMGLFLLQQVPIVPVGDAAMQMMNTDAEGEEVEFPHDSGDSTMGFLGELKKLKTS